MRIAFVGKGGSGKSTMAALFSLYAQTKTPVLSIDADINMHLSQLLGKSIPPFISDSSNSKEIKEYLRGSNKRIKKIEHLRKTTPPGLGSQLLFLSKHNPLLEKYTTGNDSSRLLVVGSYQKEDIGASCYHNNLSILENILSHLVDFREIVVIDMVAGVDAFANTLHAQCDLLVLIVEPTKRSIDVYTHYQQLAKAAEIDKRLFVIGNKLSSPEDRAYIQKYIPQDKIIGYFSESTYLHQANQSEKPLDLQKLEVENRAILERCFQILCSQPVNHQKRLQKLHQLHNIYVSQPSIKDRFGDLTDQIDPFFIFPH